MMAKLWQSPQFLLAILVTLVAFTYQAKKKSFISIHEMSGVENYVKETLQFVTNEYNRESDDKYNFRILRILRLQKQLTDHLEFHVKVEMQRTVCQKPENSNTCAIQEGELYKKIQCYFAVFSIPWIEMYKILNKNCSNT